MYVCVCKNSAGGTSTTWRWSRAGLILARDLRDNIGRTAGRCNGEYCTNTKWNTFHWFLVQITVPWRHFVVLFAEFHVCKLIMLHSHFVWSIHYLTTCASVIVCCQQQQSRYGNSFVSMDFSTHFYFQCHWVSTYQTSFGEAHIYKQCHQVWKCRRGIVRRSNDTKKRAEI